MRHLKDILKIKAIWSFIPPPKGSDFSDQKDIKRTEHISESAFEVYKDFDLEIDNNGKTPLEAYQEILENIRREEEWKQELRRRKNF